MRNSTWLVFGGQVLRFLVVLVIVVILAPKLFVAFFGLYNYLVQRDRMPSGNPLKVEAPSPAQAQEPFVFSLRPGQRN